VESTWILLERLASHRIRSNGVKPGAHRRTAVAALSAAACVFTTAAIAPLAAQEPAASKTLLPGPGAALTMAKCSICHDITHVTRSRLSRDEWDDNIRVMIARGMPNEPAELAVILEYLATYYNRDKPPPAQSATEQPTGASAVERVLTGSGCTACHALDKRLVGPGFREIAVKYKGVSGATAQLAAKVKEGGAGAWGPVPMPPHPQIADDDLREVVAWILQQ
jgi:cytochrome c551/c552